MGKKYELTTDFIVTAFGVKLFRIRALVAFGCISAGELGGYIEKESNLNQSGDAWVYDNAQVSGDAWVCGNAQVSDNARVFGNAWVSDDARVFGNAWVSDNAWVFGNAWVSDDARVFDNAWVSDDAQVFGNARVFGDARVFGNAWVFGNAGVSDNAWVFGNAGVSGNAWVFGNAWVYGIRCLLWISLIGSRNGTTTFFTTKEKKIHVNCGCFSGDIEAFEAKVKKTHGDNEHGQAYMLAIQLAKLRLAPGLEGITDDENA